MRTIHIHQAEIIEFEERESEQLTCNLGPRGRKEDITPRLTFTMHSFVHYLRSDSLATYF